MRCVLALSGAMATAIWAGPIDDPAPRPNGLFEHQHRCHALIGADVVTAPGERLDDATIILRNGRIEAVGVDIPIPADARLWPMQDQVIYAGFIEPAASVAVETLPSGPGSHWNDRIHPQLNLGRQTGLQALTDSTKKSLREAGYCLAAVYPANGILRGTGGITTLPESLQHTQVHGSTPAMAAAFERGGWGGSGPGSLMGSIALIRQTLSDANWYTEAIAAAERNHLEPPTRRDDLAALWPILGGEQVLMLDVRDEKEAIRAGDLSRELGFTLALIGSGDEFKDIPGIASLNCPLIVPLDYPKRPTLDSIDAAMRVPLRALQEWEQAPTNLRRLHTAGVTTCVTTQNLKKPVDVHKALRQAIKAGLAPDVALAQITMGPAALLGLSEQAGRIAPGMAAHLVVCDGNLFDEDTEILETWVSGHRHDHERDPVVALTGSGTITIGDATADTTLDWDKKKLTITLADNTKAKIKKVTLAGHRLTAAIDGRLLGRADWVRLAGVVRGNTVVGRAVLSDGSSLPMQLLISEAGLTDEKDEDVETDDTDEPNSVTLVGSWVGSMQLGPEFEAPLEIVVEHDGDELSGTLLMMEQEIPLGNATWDEETGSLTFQGSDPDGSAYSITATVDGDTIEGTATSSMGDATFTVSRDSEAGDAPKVPELRWTGIPEQIPYPLGARGRLQPVEPEDVRFEHATLWTAADAGIIDDGCLIVRAGRIVYAGPMSAAPQPPESPNSTERIVDATGLHITPGMIDCHSHTGIDGGVNEFNKACTAEVGIGDVIAGDDMNWYRQLAGGLTGANQLHGSANPIGGRNSVVKIRWGQPARDFPNTAAPTGIKFALGENVKRSGGRYPDTRMGVEAFIRDRLSEARSYAARWARWNAMTPQQQSREIPPRRDYELGTLAEVLAGERLIHCHSYRQDEILALLRTCEEFGITIGTLQHILEGYKVADDIAAHGCGASSFSDWWAYKIEVMDAIPWNGAIMHDQGVVVSFNSDDSELATRMNDEAAKAVRFGGLPPEEAIKFVTLNPAIQLRIDDRTGSLEAGKDADFVVWNRDPLDSYSLCMQTWIDGARFFDRGEDARLAERDGTDRARLVQLVLHESLGEPPEPEQPQQSAEEETSPAWAHNPYEAMDDLRGCCGLPANHAHRESLK